MRKSLVTRWKANPPDLFIGIDAPDFNLHVEKSLYQANIPSVHYVSPSVWAWRESRVEKMKGSMSLMLTLFPFEVDFYKKHGIPAEFCGHPLADEIPLHSSPLTAQHPDWLFVAPMVNENIQSEFEKLKQAIAPQLPITYIKGQSRTVMQASDQILMASGTAVLEGMLVGRPMVAAYRVAPLTAKIIRLFNMIKSKYYTLPNNLANEYLVPELIQEDISATSIAHEIENQFQQDQLSRQHMLNRFDEIHRQLRQNASEKAALAIQTLLNKENVSKSNMR